MRPHLRLAMPRQMHLRNQQQENQRGHIEHIIHRQHASLLVHEPVDDSQRLAGRVAAQVQGRTGTV